MGPREHRRDRLVRVCSGDSNPGRFSQWQLSARVIGATITGMVVVVAGLVWLLSAVVTVVLTPMFGWLRAGGPLQSALQRWLCRRGFHPRGYGPWDKVDDPTDPCMYEWRCSACGRLREASRVHSYGPPAAKDKRCRRMATCELCGHETWTVSHRIRHIRVVDLPDAELPQRPDAELPHIVPWRDRTDCRSVDVCQDCGGWSFGEAAHDWEVADGWDGYVCSQCGKCEPVNEA